MEIVGYQRVGKTFWVRFRLLSVDPVTLEETPQESAQAGYIEVIRPDGTRLHQAVLNEDLQNMGGGWYSAHFLPDIHGKHVVRAAAQVAEGFQMREVADFVVYEG